MNTDLIKLCEKNTPQVNCQRKD